MSRQALGRGLRALIPGDEASPSGGRVEMIPVDQIVPGTFQPRQQVDEARLQELADSIAVHGVLEPLVVRRKGPGYELVVGERRWRAAQKAGLREVPALVRELTDSQAAELALVENLQREDLNPLEEAEAYRRLMEEFGLTQEEVARRVGKPRSTVANRLRLLELDPAVKELVRSGRLSAGHAKALLGLEAPEEQRALGEQMVATGASVREAEALVRAAARRRPRRGRVEASEDVQLNELRERLQERLGTRVRIVRGGQGGRLEIEFFGDEDLERVAEIILGSELA